MKLTQPFEYANRNELRASRAAWLDIGLSCALSFIALVSVPIIDPLEALEWPTIDIIPIVEVLLGRDYPPTDYFTFASSIPNPRHAMGWLVASICMLTGASIGSTLLALKIIVAGGIAPLFYLFIVRCIDRWQDNRHTFILVRAITFGFAAAALTDCVSNHFSVAWWPPLILKPVAQTLSLLLVLVVLNVLLTRWHCRYVLITPLFAAATCLHPALSIMAAAFAVPMLPTPILHSKQLWIGIGLGYIMSVTLPLMLFSPQVTLPTPELTYIYAWLGHAEHYVPSYFSSHSRWPWWLSAALLSAMTLTGGILSTPAIRSRSLFAIILYLGSIAAQYVFVELYPLRSIVLFGPSRFTQFGYWISAFFCTAGVAHLQTRSSFLLDRKLIAGGIACILLLVVPQMMAKRTSKFGLTTEQSDLVAWLRNNTSSDAVMAAPFGWPPLIRFGAGRAVYAGVGFPFSEDAFREYRIRTEHLYGSFSDMRAMPGSWVGEQALNFYRSLGPSDFVRMSRERRIDYVIVESSHAAAFDTSRIAHRCGSILIFDLAALKAQ